MSRFNTGNPIGSADPRDRDDNSKNLDELVNSQDKAEHPDRLGVPRKTWHGMEQEFEGDQTRRENEFDTAQDGRQAQFAQLMISGGYEFVGDYEAGIELTAYKQVVRDGGELWRPAADTDLPYTTDGSGLPEGGAFVNIGDGLLRQDLVQPVATFNNVADMKGAAGLDVGRKARTLGYYSPGDGGGNDYEIVAAGTGVDDGGSFIELGGSGLKAKGLFLGGVNVKQFGATGDGVVDDTVFVQNSFAYISKNKGVLFVPKGEYLLTASIQTQPGDGDFIVEGEGYESKFITSNETDDVFVIGDRSSPTKNVWFYRISVAASVVKTAGWAFYMPRCPRSGFQNVQLSAGEDPENLYNGIWFDFFDVTRVSACHIKVQNIGIRCNGDIDNTKGAELTIDGLTRILGSGTGIVLAGGAGGVKIDECDIIGLTRGIVVNRTVSDASNRELNLGSTVSIDSCSAEGIQIQGGNTLAHLKAVGTWIASNNRDLIGYGAIDLSDMANVRAIFTGCRVYNNHKDGFVINSGYVVISGGEVHTNGLSDATRGGIRVNGANLVTVNGNSFRRNEGYDIRLSAGAAESVSVVGNTFDGFASIGLDGPAFDEPNVVTGYNSGPKHKSENWGLVTGLTTDSDGEVTIEHGLYKAPSYISADVSGDSVSLSGEAKGGNATSITVRVKNDTDGSDAPDKNVSIYWIAKV